MSSFIEALEVNAQHLSLATLEIAGEDHKRSGDRFVRGPIPSEWLERAAQLPGKALHAAMAIRYLNGCKQAGVVKLRPSVRNAYGMDRFSCSRALDQLEAAGLVQVTRRPGASPVATILETAQPRATRMVLQLATQWPTSLIKDISR